MYHGVTSGKFRHSGLVNLSVASQDLNNATVCPQSSFLPSTEAYYPRSSQQNSLGAPTTSQANVFHQRTKVAGFAGNGLRHSRFSVSANFTRQVVTFESEWSEEGWEEVC